MKFFVVSNGFSMLVVTAVDDPDIAVWFDASSLEEAAAMDTSNVDGMTVSQMEFEYPARVFKFNASSFEQVTLL